MRLVGATLLTGFACLVVFLLVLVGERADDGLGLAKHGEQPTQWGWTVVSRRADERAVNESATLQACKSAVLPINKLSDISYVVALGIGQPSVHIATMKLDLVSSRSYIEDGSSCPIRSASSQANSDDDDDQQNKQTNQQNMNTTTTTTSRCYNPSLSTSYELLSVVAPDIYCSYSREVFRLDETTAQLLQSDDAGWTGELGKLAFCLSTPSSSLFPDASDGILGLGAPSLFPFGEFNVFDVLPSGMSRQLGLRLPSNGNVGQLWLGQQDPQFRAAVDWSETQVTSDDGRRTFPVYSPQLCGHSLLAPHQANHWAYVSTTQQCLSLPKELFAAASAWLHGCQATSIGSRRLLRCPRGNATSSDGGALPLFSFRLSQSGAQLDVSLDWLLLSRYTSPTTGQTQDTLCIAETDARDYSGDVPMIGLGTKVLEHFYLAVTDQPRRVGLAAADSAADSCGGQCQLCSQPVACSAPSVFRERDNSCQHQHCRAVFQRYDEASGRCVFETFMLALLLSFGGCALLFELLWFEISAYYQKKVARFLLADPSPQELLAEG